MTSSNYNAPLVADPRRQRRSRAVARRVACAAGLALVLVAGSCSNETRGRDESVAPKPAAQPPAPPPGLQELVVDLSGDTSTDPPIDGLLSVTLTPDGTRLLTVQDTADGSITVRSFPYSHTARLTPQDGFDVMRVPHPYVHSGGAIAVAASGDAYVTIGAFTRPGEPLGVQNPDGSLIRIPARFLADPAAAPFVPTVDDVVARGFRNPWRMTIDPVSGDIWVGDVGEGIEEINRIPAPSPRSPVLNFGWPYIEGENSGVTPPPRGLELTAPVWWGDHNTTGGSAVIGGYVYRGNAVPELKGQYVFGDLSSQKVSALDPERPERGATQIGSTNEGFTSFGEDRDGELVVLGVSGTFYRLMPTDDGQSDLVAPEWGGGIWQYPPTGNVSEATSIVHEPDGPSFVASERSGLVTRITPGERSNPACPVDLVEVPNLANGSNLRSELAAYRTFAAEHLDQIPESLRAAVTTMLRFADAIEAIASRSTWDDPEIGRLVTLARVERGPHGDAQRAVASINGYFRQICPPLAPADSDPDR